MPDYAVDLTYSARVVVLKADNEEHALNLAQDEISPFGLELFESKVRKLKRGRETDTEVRHADAVSRPV